MTYPDSHTESPGSWLSPIFSCIPLASCLGRRARRSTPPVPTTATEQPESTSPTSEQDLLVDRDDEDEKMRTSAGGPKATTTVAVPPWRRGLTSIKSLFTTLRPESGPPRRPRISAPSDFRHLQSGSGPLRIAPPPEDEQERFHHATHTSAQEAETHTQLRPRPNRPARPSSFRPLELSIYRRNSRRISSMMSFFEMPGSNATAIPEPAHLRERLDNDHQLVRQRTTSSVPFHLPLRPATDTASSQEDSTSSSASHSSDEQKPPAVPEKSLARGRAYTSPDIESIRARVANAMIEAERLQQRIDHVIERQSLYSASRPSTAHSMARTLPELEPMPSIPALPPPAPSFAARLNSELERPQTTPPTMGASNGDHYVVHQVDNGYRRDYDRDDDDEDDDDLDRFPPPPLPLVLRPPPLRKKKSFSRVSNWLFPRDQKQQDQEQGQAGHHSRDISLDSVTNLPRPVKGSQGFYQCVAPGGQGRDSFDSMATMSTWDSDDCPRTVPTASPVDMSGPVKVQDLPPLERVGTFGTS